MSAEDVKIRYRKLRVIMISKIPRFQFDRRKVKVLLLIHENVRFIDECKMMQSEIEIGLVRPDITTLCYFPITAH